MNNHHKIPAKIVYTTALIQAGLIVLSIVPGHPGFTPESEPLTGQAADEAEHKVAEENFWSGLTHAQIAAAEHGAAFGWNAPCSDPANFDATGYPILTRHE